MKQIHFVFELKDQRQIEPGLMSLVNSLMLEQREILMNSEKQMELNFQMHNSNLFQKSQMFWKKTMHW